MQSGIDSSRLRIAAEIPTPGKADAEPLEAKAYPTQTASASTAPKPQAAPPTAAAGSSKGFFGPDGPSFRDALDAINPLNQIPIVSDILANVTGHEPSTASKLAGGAIAAVISGPISIVASLASVIFEDGAGKTPGNAVYAAIAGDSGASAVQVAKADTYVEPVESTQLASLEPAATSTADAIAAASARADAAQAATGIPAASNAVLDLYGASASSAHASYKKAQLLPYLRDVNHTRVL